MNKYIQNKCEYVVEKEFEHAGLKCVVVMQRMAHRCGYVGVNKDHPLYGKDYEDHLNITMSEMEGQPIGKRNIISIFAQAFDDTENVMIETFFDVHGGITYAGHGEGKYPIESDLWWFGFDCAHLGDEKDFETAKKLFADDKGAMKSITYFENMERMYPTDGEIRTLDYVADECKRLAEQLAEFR